jgi:TATA-binding protein-associated factor
LSGEKPYLSDKIQIDSLPHLIICPGTLRAQWIAELKTLFMPKSVDILIYEGGSKFWSDEGTFGISKQSAHNRIIVMTHSVLLSKRRQLFN